jgi:hypothetical protein
MLQEPDERRMFRIQQEKQMHIDEMLADNPTWTINAHNSVLFYIKCKRRARAVTWTQVFQNPNRLQLIYSLAEHIIVQGIYDGRWDLYIADSAPLELLSSVAITEGDKITLVDGACLMFE